MTLNAEFIKQLIKEDNPVPIVGKKLLELWLNLAREENNLSDYYYKGEEKAKSFEEFILKSYSEFYSYLAKQLRSMEDLAVSLSFYDVYQRVLQLFSKFFL